MAGSLKNNWDWLGLVLLAMLAVVTIWLFVNTEGMTAKVWLETALPAWLQGLGTILAAWFAWKAYRSWRDQEHTKRRADAAEKLLQAAFETAESVTDSRSASVVNFKEDELSDLLINLLIRMATTFPGRAPIDKAADAAGRLRTLSAVGRLYFGKEVADAARSVYAARDVVRGAFDALERNKTARAPDSPTEFRDDNDTVLLWVRLLGVHLKADEVKDGKDRFERDLEAHLEKLQQLLSPYLKYQG